MTSVNIIEWFLRLFNLFIPADNKRSLDQRGKVTKFQAGKNLCSFKSRNFEVSSLKTFEISLFFKKIFPDLIYIKINQN